MKGCLTEAMAPRGERGHDDAILIDDNNDGDSSYERGGNDINMVDSKKYLSFIIVRDESRGKPSLKDEVFAEILQADPIPFHEFSSEN